MSDDVDGQLAQLRLDYERLARQVEDLSTAHGIERLAHRYAFAADARDLEMLVSLFVDDVDCGRLGTGHDALRASYQVIHRRFYRTIHHVVGHVVDDVDGDRATGRVMMRAEHEVGDRWVTSMLCMFDTYARRDGQWRFVRRKPESWYTTDGSVPRGPDWSIDGWEGRPPRMPQLMDSWGRFWNGHEADTRRLTGSP